ncbi:hypothetical protein LTR36_009673 [Oleoguttula mirabilis]|uniref:Uncharacterized protein n=1 Tax=Oleoguttula mirabilis TaxID=1507867 RepID=A0AAV9J788_9PEZI|nr:hypothetical protein LTR36_009673 [Oleoguttula mirabilis]
MRDRHEFPDVESETIEALFPEADSPVDWDQLCGHVDDALANLFLPHWYRGEYEAIRAWHSDFPKQNIQRAKDAVEDMRGVLEADDHDEGEEQDGPGPAAADEGVESQQSKRNEHQSGQIVAPKAGVKRKRTQEVTPLPTLPIPPASGPRPTQPM